MSNKSKVKTVKDRNVKYRKWSPLIPYQVSEFDKADGTVAIFQNHIVTVFVREHYTHDFIGMFDIRDAIKIVELIMRWSDINRRDTIPYSIKQKSKNEICGPNCEYVELGPAVIREVNYKNDRLWVFPPGFILPVGAVPSDFEKTIDKINKLSMNDIEFFIVDNKDGVFEVFADEDDCKTIYAGNSISENSEAYTKKVNEIEWSDNYVLSDKAKDKMKHMQNAAMESSQIVDSSPDGMVEDVVEDSTEESIPEA